VNFYNDIDPFCCEWTENLIKEGLIPNGIVSRVSIKDLAGEDLSEFTQIHLFNGISGWALALRLAGWPDDRKIGTGSCPCQPFSSAGEGKGFDDARDLWPAMFEIIKKNQDRQWVGEQVASSDVVGTRDEAAFVAAVQKQDFAKANKLAERIAERVDESEIEGLSERWLDRVQADLATIDYSLWPAILGAHSVNSPNKRQRVWWLACAASLLGPEQRREPGREARREKGPKDSAEYRGSGFRLAESRCECHERRGIAGELSVAAAIPETEAQQRKRSGDANSDCCSDVAVASAEGAGSSASRFTESPVCQLGVDDHGAISGMANGDRERLEKRQESDGSEIGCGIDPSRRADSSGRGEPRWLGDAESERWIAERDEQYAAERRSEPTGIAGADDRLEHATGDGRIERRSEPSGRSVIGGCCNDNAVALGDSDNKRSQRRFIMPERSGELPAGPTSPWSEYRIIQCTDGKSRRIGSRIFPLANGIPFRGSDERMEPLLSALRGLGHSAKDAARLIKRARSNRVGRLKGAGNAINPWVAAMFIRSFMEVAGISSSKQSSSK